MNRANIQSSRTISTSKAAPRPKSAAGSSPRKGGMEAMLARVEAVRLAQRQEGNFDCFAKAKDGYCDQEGCLYRADCLKIAKKLP